MVPTTHLQYGVCWKNKKFICSRKNKKRDQRLALTLSIQDVRGKIIIPWIIHFFTRQILSVARDSVELSNYLESPLSVYSLAILCMPLVVFVEHIVRTYSGFLT